MAEAAEALVPIQAAYVEMCWNTKEGFALMQRAAALLAASDLVPKQFKGNVANTTIALEMSQRLGASPLAVMQNLYIVHGKPGWSSQFIIAAINSTGKFSPLRFTITDPEPEREITATITEYENGQKSVKNIKERICNRTCTAWAIEKASGDRLESPPVSLEMAVKEGWYSKNGSKWQTMPDLMLRYRSATFFGRLYAPEVLMGMKTTEEIVDITPPEEEIQPGRPSEPTKGVDGLKAKLGIVSDPEPEKEKDSPPASTTPPDADSTGAGAPGTASASPSDPPKVAEREPGADEGEDALPFGKTEKAPTDSSEIPAYLNRATSIEDLSVRWDACKPVFEKCSPMMKKAYEKHRDERKKALAGGGAV